MAKKSRTPPPPRRVQAPKKRTGHRQEGAGTRRLPLLLGAGGAAAAVVVVLVALLAFGGSNTPVPEVLADAGCTYREVQARENVRRGLRHVLELPKGFKYNTDPPTSGLHNPQTIIWGIYDAPVDQLRSVHNLEHGGVVIQYGNTVPEPAVARLGEFYRDDPNGVVVAPLPRLGSRVSIAAWTFDVARLNERGYEGEGRLALCPRFDEGALRKFRDEYRGHGPEPAELEQLAPGNP